MKYSYCLIYLICQAKIIFSDCSKNSLLLTSTAAQQFMVEYKYMIQFLNVNFSLSYIMAAVLTIIFSSPWAQRGLFLRTVTCQIIIDNAILTKLYFLNQLKSIASEVYKSLFRNAQFFHCSGIQVTMNDPFGNQPQSARAQRILALSNKSLNGI